LKYQEHSHGAINDVDLLQASAPRFRGSAWSSGGVLLGIAMIVLPGPAFIVIPIGLAGRVRLGAALAARA